MLANTFRLIKQPIIFLDDEKVTDDLLAKRIDHAINCALHGQDSEMVEQVIQFVVSPFSAVATLTHAIIVIKDPFECNGTEGPIRYRTFIGYSEKVIKEANKFMKDKAVRDIDIKQHEDKLEINLLFFETV